ncbi:toll/interleukin-1 receptor-like protein [Lactuca sativa]|uniref:toll/interleukin-1 receptor-like protein n=1 Tax=Lactuca sativa TaxID=4236 RepID=UPI0022AEE04D|nr:toll/interleukin-1 receptor-like protein [Lactuca sativa]
MCVILNPPLLSSPLLGISFETFVMAIVKGGGNKDPSSIPSMTFSSTSSIPRSFKYDVLLSFRDEDTRTNFIDHLYSSLQMKSIYTYKEDERTNKEKRINDELIRSIEDSRFYIIIFSKNYASSSWCLDELVKIMECDK